MNNSTLIQENEHVNSQQGRLKLFFSYSLATGTTSSMLDEAMELENIGKKVAYLSVLEPSSSDVLGEDYSFKQALKEQPDILVVDKLIGSSELEGHEYKYQDVLTCLESGIDVYATLEVKELAQESEFVEEITGLSQVLTLPQDIFYRADELEFIDIEPKDLALRLEKINQPYDLVELKELRTLALRCVMDFAAQTKQNNSDELDKLKIKKILVPVLFDGSEYEVIKRAAASAASSDASLQVIYVNPEHNVLPTGEKLNETIDKLKEFSEDSGAEFVLLHGDDSLGLISDYALSHDITDVYTARPEISFAQRLLLPVHLRPSQKLEKLLPNVVFHMVPIKQVSSDFKNVYAGAYSSIFSLSVKDFFFTILTVVIATGIIMMLSNFGFTNTTAVLIYVLASTIIAIYTKGYLAGIIGSILSIVALSYFFVVPYYSFEVDHKAHYFTFVILLIVALVITTLSSRMRRSTERSKFREQHTQVLYELNKAMLSSRGINEVVSSTLNTVTKIFGKAAVFYTTKPLAKVEPKAKPAPDDVNIKLFSLPQEKEAARWAFEHNEVAGAGTGEFPICEGRYYPVAASDKVRGVIGVSMRTGFLNQEHNAFLNMVVSQTALAFERQLLNEEHRRDLREAQLESIRGSFASSLSSYAASSTSILSQAIDLLMTMRTNNYDSGSYYEEAIALVRQESILIKRYIDALHSILQFKNDDEATFKGMDFAMLVKSAIKKTKEILPEAHINFDDRNIQNQIFGDKYMLQMAISNLITYAVLHSPKGSRIDVSVKIYKGQTSVSVADEQENLEVSDLNAVLSKEYINKRQKEQSDLVERLAAHAKALDANKSVSIEHIAKAPQIDDDILRAADASEIERQAEEEQKYFDLQKAKHSPDRAYLILAAVAFRAHGGSVRVRKRLGGGAVSTAWFNN